MRRSIFLAALAVLMAIPSFASAQAWIAAPGDGYAELSYRRISGDQFFNSDYEVQDLASTFTQQTIGLYAQAGVVERWLQLSLQSELYRRNELEDQGATAGLGDTRLGAWTGLLQGKHNLAFGLQLGIPTGDPDPGEGIEDPEQRIIASTLPTGDGNFDVTPTLSYGVGFGGQSWPLRHYFTASTGYMLRTDGAGDSVEWLAELGILAPYSVLKRVWFLVTLSGLEPVGDTDSGGFSGLGDGVSYTGIALGANVSIWNGLGLLVRVESAVRAANIIAAAPLKVGLYWSF